jgi:hypothetical protein
VPAIDASSAIDKVSKEYLLLALLRLTPEFAQKLKLRVQAVKKQQQTLWRKMQSLCNGKALIAAEMDKKIKKLQFSTGASYEKGTVNLTVSCLLSCAMGGDTSAVANK